MQVNSVTPYRHQSSNYFKNRSNVNFGKAKIVCENNLLEIFDAPIKLLQEAEWFEKLGQKYNLEAHFEMDVPYDPMNRKANTYKMILKPYKYSFKEKIKNLREKPLPVLPCVLEFSSTSIADCALNHFDNIVGLMSKINSIDTEKITAMIKEKTTASQVQ